MSDLLVRLLESAPVRHNDIPPDLADALHIARRNGLVKADGTGWGDNALDFPDYAKSLNPYYRLTDAGKDALALARLQAPPTTVDALDGMKYKERYRENEVPAEFREGGKAKGKVLTTTYLKPR